MNRALSEAHKHLIPLVWVFILAPAPLLIWLGYRMCQGQPESRAAADSRRPILFLRPFTDDISTSLQPPGLAAAITGVRAKLLDYGIFDLYGRQGTGRVRLIDLMMLYHPTRLMRLLFDVGVDSTEESIVRFFKPYGPVVAIGKPGEILAPPGSVRTYVPDDKWQERFRTELNRAQAVILQPGFSIGVHWELTEIYAKVGPRNLLLCLASYWRNPKEYETLCVLVRRTLHLDLPRRIPFAHAPAFVFFDDHWAPFVQELSYRCPVLWPIVGDAADLRYTLQPFTQRLRGERGIPRNGRWQQGLGSILAKAAACILGIVVILTPGKAVHLAANLIFPAWEAKRTLTEIGSAHSDEFMGRSVRYAIDVPEVFVKQAPLNDAMEYFFAAPDNRMDFKILAFKEHIDLSSFARDLLQISDAAVKSSQLESVETVSHAKVDWIEVRILRTMKTGQKIREVGCITSTVRGTVYILFHHHYYTDSKSLCDDVIAGILSSFRWTNSP